MAALLLVIAGCAGKEKSPPDSAATPDTIGVAWLENDGTLVLQLRAQGTGKSVGDALLRYKPGDPEYSRTLQHIGGLEPGQTKPVPPWPAGERNPAR